MDPSRGPKVTCCVIEKGDPHAQLAASTCHRIVMWIVINRSCGPLLLPRHMDQVSGPRDTCSGVCGWHVRSPKVDRDGAKGCIEGAWCGVTRVWDQVMLNVWWYTAQACQVMSVRPVVGRGCTLNHNLIQPSRLHRKLDCAIFRVLIYTKTIDLKMAQCKHHCKSDPVVHR